MYVCPPKVTHIGWRIKLKNNPALKKIMLLHASCTLLKMVEYKTEIEYHRTSVLYYRTVSR